MGIGIGISLIISAGFLIDEFWLSGRNGEEERPDPVPSAEEKIISISDLIIEKAVLRNPLNKLKGKPTNADLEKVTALDLTGTQITDEGLKEVVKLQKLEALWLSNTKITDENLKELAKLQKLQELFLDGTKVTAAGVAELKKAMPNCEIYWPSANSPVSP